jgi:GMP synthase (glutamine-hydrolysing)
MNVVLRFILLITATQLCSCGNYGVEKPDFLILHMGSSATNNIARRLEYRNATYIILDGLVPVEEIKAINPKAIVITGSPDSVMEEGSPRAHKDYYNLNIPILGLCYGMQMIVEQLGGKVKKCTKSEKEVVLAQFNGKCGLAPAGLKEMHVLMDHDDCVVELPKGFHSDASTSITEHAMVCSHDRQMYLFQFHPERYDTVPASGVFLDMFINKIMKRK